MDKQTKQGNKSVSSNDRRSGMIELGNPSDQRQYRPHQLPTFDGFTVDVRLREFRKAEYGKALEFVPFDSRRGQQILDSMKEFIAEVRTKG